MPTTLSPLDNQTQSRIDLSARSRETVIPLLSMALASVFDLQSQAKQAHWNVKGPQFIALHELFDQLAETLEGHVDTIAERITALGGYAFGTVRCASANSILPEYPLEQLSGLKHVEALADRYAQVAKLIRDSIDKAAAASDADTADLFTEVSRDLDKGLWFLEAHLAG